MNPTAASATLLLVSLLVLVGCTTRADTRDASAPAAAAPAAEPDEGDDITTAMSGVRFRIVPERFLTASTPADNVDSPASWQDESGRTWLIATAKGTHRLMLYDGDSGASLRTIGAEGEGDGEFARPNGVFVIDDLVFVVERDNRRVQVLRLPGFAPLGHFGSGELEKPYGLWLRPTGNGTYEVLVSDAYMDPRDEDRVPPFSELDRRFKRYAITVDARRISAQLLGTFGASDEAGAIRVPESLWADPVHDRLLISEEDQPTGTRLREYRLSDLRYAGSDHGAGLFHAQAEGMALWACADGNGYWIATDQYTDRSVFHVFDRVHLRHLGAFAGETTANTDGVWLQQSPTRAFPAGVFYAVHDDQGVAAFDWRDIAQALALRTGCE